MSIVRLIYFEGCPNAERVKGLLLKIGVPFQEVRQDDLREADPLRSYTSPTILSGEEIIMGTTTEGTGGGCSVDFLSADELKLRLQLNTPTTTRKRGMVLSVVGSVFSAATVGLCPVCIPALGAFLSAIGMGFLVKEAVLKPLLLAFLGISLFGFFWSYLKEHGRLGPFFVGLIFAVGLYVSRYVYLGSTTNSILMYGSIAGIIGASIWNIRLKKKSECCACNSKGNDECA